MDWMQDPRYAGSIAGHFHVEGAGADSATMTLKGGGRLTRADLFGGALSDAEVSVSIAAGSLTASYDGRFTGVNPAFAFDDPRIDAIVERHRFRDDRRARPADTDDLARPTTTSPGPGSLVALDRSWRAARQGGSRRQALEPDAPDRAAGGDRTDARRTRSRGRSSWMALVRRDSITRSRAAMSGSSRR